MKAVFTTAQLHDFKDGTFGVLVENPLKYDYDQGPPKGTKLSGQGQTPTGKVFLSVTPDGGWECRPNDPKLCGAWERFYKQGNLLIVRPSEYDTTVPPVSYSFVFDDKKA